MAGARALVVVLVVLVVACRLSAAAEHSASSKANIVMVLIDDQDLLMGYSSMPKTRQLIVEQGASMQAMFGSTPVCCPSRGGMQTGRYIHNVPMRNNSLQGNCSGEAWREGAEKFNMATYMKKAGYRTAYMGKYLNEYGEPAAGGVSLVPPGWDDWQGLRGNSIYYNYVLSNNGVAEQHGNDPQKDYLPKVLQRKAMAFLENVTTTAPDSPFFLMIGTPSCHDPTEPAAEYTSLLPDATAPRTPNYGGYYSDKHWFVANQGPISGFPTYAKIEEDYNDLQYRRRALTLMSVDDIIGNITQYLGGKGLLNNTYIFTTADNGYHLGQFAVMKDKRLPYESDIHLPGAVRGPGIKPNSTVANLVTMIDYAPTFLDIAGVELPSQMDGMSILPLLHNTSGTPVNQRVDFLVEYYGEGMPESAPAGNCSIPGMSCGFVGPEMKAVPPYWPNGPVCSCQDAHNNTYACVRTLEPHPGGRNWIYCEFYDMELTVLLSREFYNITSDYWQRHNQINDVDPSIIAQQAQRLQQLRTCQGASCRSNQGSSNV